METEEEVEAYLRDFKIKLRVWNVVFLDERGKNFVALEELKLLPVEREGVLMDLQPKDYSEGPIQDKMMRGSDLLVFGKTINGHEVYIKICMGKENCPVICISFHRAEYPMQYPFKPK